MAGSLVKLLGKLLCEQMPIAKLKASGTPDVMKTEDRIDTLIRQAIGKEPFIPFPRASESPVQWIQLLHALDPQGVSNTFSGLNIIFLEVHFQKHLADND